MNYWQIALAIIGYKIYSVKDFKPNIKYFLAPPNEYDINDVEDFIKKQIYFTNYNSNNSIIDNKNNYIFKTTYRFRC